MTSPIGFLPFQREKLAAALGLAPIVTFTLRYS
jgi:hypothetical protein